MDSKRKIEARFRRKFFHITEISPIYLFGVRRRVENEKRDIEKHEKNDQEERNRLERPFSEIIFNSSFCHNTFSRRLSLS